MNRLQALTGREVAIGSFVAPHPQAIPEHVGARVGPITSGRVVRATRASVTIQRWACGGWHTGAHGKFTVAWSTGRERKQPTTTIESRVHPISMAWLRLLAFGTNTRTFFDVDLRSGRIA